MSGEQKQSSQRMINCSREDNSLVDDETPLSLMSDYIVCWHIVSLALSGSFKFPPVQMLFFDKYSHEIGKLVSNDRC